MSIRDRKQKPPQVFEGTGKSEGASILAIVGQIGLWMILPYVLIGLLW